jgi:hypothetical protein
MVGENWTTGKILPFTNYLCRSPNDLLWLGTGRSPTKNWGLFHATPVLKFGEKLSAKNMTIKPMVVPPDFFPNQPTDPPNINLHPACSIVAILRLLLQHLESFKRSTQGASLLLISSSMHKLNLPIPQIIFESVQGHLYKWEFQDPKMEVLYHIRPYFVGISPYIGLI